MARYTIPDYKHLPAPFNTLCARFRLAKIKFRVLESQTGCAIELVLPEDPRAREELRERTWAIWQGTK